MTSFSSDASKVILIHFCLKKEFQDAAISAGPQGALARCSVGWPACSRISSRRGSRELTSSASSVSYLVPVQSAPPAAATSSATIGIPGEHLAMSAANHSRRNILFLANLSIFHRRSATTACPMSAVFRIRHHLTTTACPILVAFQFLAFPRAALFRCWHRSTFLWIPCLYCSSSSESALLLSPSSMVETSHTPKHCPFSMHPWALVHYPLTTWSTKHHFDTRSVARSYRSP